MALSKGKAKEILHDGTVRGRAITDRQRRFMGAVASGRSRKTSRGRKSGR